MEPMNRRQAAITLASFAAVAMAPATSQAQAFPDRPVKIVVPYGVGTVTDSAARTIAERLSEMWGVAVTVENPTGAGGVVGTQAIARARPDGHTLGMLSSSHAVNAALYSNLPYDPVRDFKLLMHVAYNQYAFCVNPAVPVKTLQDLVALAKAKPNTVTYASSGNGGSVHLATAKLAAMAGMPVRHVPYKSNGAAVADVVSGHVDLVGTSIGVLAPLVKAGKLRALAVSGRARAPELPDVPTADEAGVKGYSMTNWIGLVGPAGIPPAVVSKIQKDMVAALNDKRTVERMSALGAHIDPLHSDEFEKKLRAEIAEWTDVVKVSGAKVE